MGQLLSDSLIHLPNGIWHGMGIFGRRGDLGMPHLLGNDRERVAGARGSGTVIVAQVVKAQIAHSRKRP
jgi:hypothetical protein